jgi:hypothetical protein
MRLALPLALAALAFLSLPLAGEARADEDALRTIEFRFTPTKHAQIAVWIEATDGTFMSTVGLTQAVSVRGIGNRPGADQMNSGYHWPYGRREGVLPIWAHRRAEAPGAGQFPRIIFQNRPEGYASRTCEDSTPDGYFCLAFSGDSSKDGLDAVTCASGFNSDKGRKIVQADVTNAYAEPFEMGGTDGMRPLSLTSLYPPRRDVTPCPSDPDPRCRAGTVRSCNDYPDVGSYDAEARTAMPDIDAVTMATPPPDAETRLMYSIPNTWPAGDYVAWIEVNTEGDYNATFNDVTYPTPRGTAWDGWAMDTGYPYRGQPSVVYSVPFALSGASSTKSSSVPAGYGSVDGNMPDIGELHMMDGTISNDPAGAPGSGADRLRQMGAETQRFTVEVRDCRKHEVPEMPRSFETMVAADTKHSHEWGALSFEVGNSLMAVTKYDVRVSTAPITAADPSSFLRGYQAVTADTMMTGLVVPTGQTPGTKVNVIFGGLQPRTHYWIAVRAVDVCNVVSAYAISELTTTKPNFTQLSGCFVATAAYGSALQPQVAALRQVRDRLLGTNAIFTAGAELYYRSGPAAAEVLRQSDTARAVTRTLLGPLGTLAQAAIDAAGLAATGN